MSLDVYLTYKTGEIFSANITHNLGEMAVKAGLYQALWRPEEIGATKARQLIRPLKKGIKLLASEPAKFKQFNAENGWGSYDVFLPWVARYLEACVRHPNATINVSR